MCVALHNQLSSKIPIKHFQGKRYNLRKCATVLAVNLLLFGFAFCHEIQLVSVPLGLEISGYEESRTRLSSNGVFEFGFLESYQEDEKNDGFVVGVRYNLGNKAANVVVWSIGGGLKVSENSTLRLSMDGRLVLVENRSGLIVWSSNTSSLGVQKASLLNSGNLVLLDSKDSVLWESFSRPTSTLLPGQSLHFPQTLRAPSTKTISSYYSFVIRRSGELALVWENNVTYWRSHLGSSAVIKEAKFDVHGVLGLIDDCNRTVWSKSSRDFEDPSVVLRHLRIDTDGNFRIYSWDDVLHTWRVGWQAVEDQCNVFGFCGLYSLCGYNSTGPLCQCLNQDPLSPVNRPFGADSGNFGCSKMVDLASCNMKTSMMALEKTVLYGLYPPQDVNIMLSEKACKEYCSTDATCIAITSKNDGSGICTLKRTSFISGYSNPFIPANSFLKVCSVPLPAAAHRANPHDYAIPIQSKRFIAHGGNSKGFLGAIILIALVTLTCFLGMEMLLLGFIYWRRQQKAQTRIPFGKDVQMNSHYGMVIRLSFKEMENFTQNFSTQLGRSVFRGTLPNKMLVIAKVLNNVVASEKDFRVTITTLGGIHHRNLVAVKGFCYDSKHKLLVYEYVPNGSLDKWLLECKSREKEQSWQQKLNIAIGIAQAISYLHLECYRCIPHGNLKLENVLLDENLVPKVSDYGLQGLFQQEAASSSESPPERDIYAFGEILGQILTCKKNIAGNNLHDLVNDIKYEQYLGVKEDREGIERMMRIALWCLQDQPFLRPSIGEIVKVLEGTLSVDRPPSVFSSKQENQITEEVVAEVKVDS